MKFLLGEKVGMTQIFNGAGNVVPVTLVSALPNTVIRRKTKETDGYGAVLLGRGRRKEKNVKKPQRGQWKDLGMFQNVKEFRIKEGEEDAFEAGGKVDVSVFQEGDKVRVTGISKSKGFQGVVKRHGFHGAPATHGTKHAHRQPGSIGATWPQRVVKGRRMAGRDGGKTITVRNLVVAKVDGEKNILALRGALPGRKGTLIEIRG